jgi:hypothetical protein
MLPSASWWSWQRNWTLPAVEAVQDGRIYIELINGPMLFEHKATPAEYSAGLKFAIDCGWLELDRSRTFVRFTQAGAELFA